MMKSSCAFGFVDKRLRLLFQLSFFTAFLFSTLRADAQLVVTGSLSANGSPVWSWPAVPGATSYFLHDGPSPTLYDEGQTLNFHPDSPNSPYSASYDWESRKARYGYVIVSVNNTSIYSNVVRIAQAPPIKPPYNHSAPLDPCGEKPCGCGGPSDGDPVDVSTGAEDYTPAPDLTVYNPNGPAVVFQREYRSDQALIGSLSQGLSLGWSHNYDVSVQSTEGTWGALTLAYPNGAQEQLTPNIDPNSHQPDGTFAMPTGTPYLVQGTPDSSHVGKWLSVTITQADRTKWTLTPAFTTLVPITPNTGETAPTLNIWHYQLTQITNRVGRSLNLTWSASSLSTIKDDSATPKTLLTLAYDGNGNLQTLTDIYNRVVTYGFGSVSGATLPQLLSVSQIGVAASPRWSYGYDNSYSAYSSSSPALCPLLHTITVSSPTGTGTAISTINYTSPSDDGYTAGGNVASLVDANGNQRVYTYNATNTQVDIKNNSGTTVLTMKRNFDSSGRDTGTTDFLTHSTVISYTDPNNSNKPPYKPYSITDRNGKITYYTYDQYGNVKTVTTPRGTVTTYSYDYSVFALGRLTSVQEGTNLSSPKTATSFTYYEPSGLVNTVTMAAPGSVSSASATITTTYIYNSLGDVQKVTTPGNNATLVGGVDQGIVTNYSYTSDTGGYLQTAAVGQPVAVTDNLGNITHFRYDVRGNRRLFKDALGNQTNYTFNLADQMLTAMFPATNQTGTGRGYTSNTYLYPGGPLMSTATYDESSSATPIRQVNYGHGPEGEMRSVSGSAEPVNYAYDALYRLSSLTDGGGHITTYSYNSIGMLANIRYPGYNSSVSTTYDRVQFPNYDNDGNLLKRIDGNGVETDYVYNDAESLLTDIKYPASTSLNVNLHYDVYGRRDQMTDSASGLFNANGTVGTPGVTYTYDDLDAPLSVVTLLKAANGTLLTYQPPMGPPVTGQTLTYAYWPDGTRQTLTTSQGNFSYSDDKDGRLATLVNPFTENTTWGYKANGWLDTQTMLNSGGNTVAVTAYTDDARGQLTELGSVNGNSTPAVLSDFAGASGTGSPMGYDGVGNRLGMTASVPAYSAYSGTTTFGYDAAQTNPLLRRSQLTSESSTRAGNYSNLFTYDGGTNGGPGNPTLLRASGTSFSFNADNQITNSGYGYDGNGNPTTYKGLPLTFDAENRLTAYNGTTLTSGYTGEGLRAWKSSGGAARNYYLYDGDLPLLEIDGSTGTSTSGKVKRVNTWGVTGLVSRLTLGSSTGFYTFDPSGNAVQRVNGNGTAAVSYVTDAFGLVNSSDGNGITFGFAGQFGGSQDSEDGFVLMGHRYYDPTAGRFLTRDPISYNGGINLYSYTKNNPVNKIDPRGLDDDPVSMYWNQLGNSIQYQATQFSHSWNNALGALGDFLTGVGSNQRSYGASSSQSMDLANSISAQQISFAIAQGGHDGYVGTVQGFENTIQEPWNGTQAQIGGFHWRTTMKNGVTIVHADNIMSFDSWWYHMPSLLGHNPFWNGRYDRCKSGITPMGNIYQDYTWKN